MRSTSTLAVSCHDVSPLSSFSAAGGLSTPPSAIAPSASLAERMRSGV
jgi:hypothetical protein